MYWFIQHICTQHLCAGGFQAPSQSRCGASWSQSDWVHIPGCISLVVQVPPSYLSLSVPWFSVLVSCLFKYSRTTHRWNALAREAFKATLGESSQCASAVITNNIGNRFGGGGGRRSFCWFQFGSERRSGQAVILREEKQMWRKREVRGLGGSDWDPYSWSGTRLGGYGILRTWGSEQRERLGLVQAGFQLGVMKGRRNQGHGKRVGDETGRRSRWQERCTLPASAEDTRLSCNQN